MKKIIQTENAPAPIGPYNQAVLFGNILFVSGQIAIDPATGNLITDNIEDEAHQVLKNVGAILEEAGLNYSDVLKASVFVKDMGLFGRINAIYTQYFGEENAPARELVEVSALPKYVNLEISVIAGKA
jgi:2-iminobutanoate/2-iminopropanoate deaminase